MTTDDWIFVIHDDFLDRTDGVGRPSIPNSAVGRHDATPHAAMQRLHHTCGPRSVSAARAAVQRRRPQDAINPFVPLLVEIERRAAVRGLLAKLGKLLTSTPQATEGAPCVSRSSAATKGRAPPPVAVSEHMVCELLTSLVLQERNDPYCHAAYLRWFEYEGAPSDNAVLSEKTVAPSPSSLFPRQFCRRRVFSTEEDLNAVVVVEQPHQLEQPIATTHNVSSPSTTLGDDYVVVGVVNPWCIRARRWLNEEGDDQLVDLEINNCKLKNGKPCVLDVLLPNPELQERLVAKSLFQRLLVWGGQSKTWAVRCAELVTKECRNAKLGLHERAQLLLRSIPSFHPVEDANNIRSPYRLEVQHSTRRVSGKDLPIVEIHLLRHDESSKTTITRTALLASSWEKLRSLYDLHQEPLDRCNHEDNDDGSVIEERNAHGSVACQEEVFGCRVLTIMARYASLSGGMTQFANQTSGFHASVPTQVYELAREKLNTVAECFASPMNVSSPLFCSLFPDCDAYFGSMGSFFDLHISQHFPDGVAMNCNPPFTLAIMSRVPKKLNELCEEGDQLHVPVQFFIVVCNWAVVSGVEQANGRRILDDLAQSVYCRRHVSVAADNAPYQDGHAFALCRPYFTLKSSTEVYLWQNHTASKIWYDHSKRPFDDVLEGWTQLQVRMESEESTKKRGRGNTI